MSGMNHIEAQVMKRVRRIYYMRKLMQPKAIAGYTLALSAVALVSLVSVPNVVANATNVGLTGFYDFAREALTGTELAVQLALVVAVVAAGLMVRDLLRQPATGKVLA